MDYLSLLPSNVHEDITQRLGVNNTYNLEISNEDFNENYKYIKLTFTPNKYFSEKLNSILKSILDEHSILKFKDFSNEGQTIIVYIQSYQIIKDVFIANLCLNDFEYDGWGPNEKIFMIYDGNHTVFFDSIAHIILTSEANKLLKQKVLELEKNCNKCTSLSSMKNEFIDMHIECWCCNTILGKGHTNCFFKCEPKFDLFNDYKKTHYVCDNCKITCDICKKIICNEHNLYCNGCNKNICDDHKTYCRRYSNQCNRFRCNDCHPTLDCIGCRTKHCGNIGPNCDNYVSDDDDY